jgi:plastocyanin
MKGGPSTHLKNSSTALATGLLWFMTAAAACAGDISGQVTILNREGTPLARFDHAVVFIEGIETAPPAEPAFMDQRNKEFVPRLLPVVKGQEIRFSNSDPIQHNVFSTHDLEPFDLGLYPQGEFKSVRLNSLRRHKVYCNLHKNMVADLFVVPNRFFSVTDEVGHYRIQGVPEGDYVLRVWHIFGGVDQKQVRIDQPALAMDFTLRSAQGVQDILAHPNKTGHHYPNAESDSY